MDASRRQRAEELFHAACDRPAAERDAFIRDACDRDEELSRFVRTLLRSSDAAGTAFLSGAPVIVEGERIAEAPASSGEAAAAQTLEEVAAALPHRYRAERIAGAGGVGRVFAARDTMLQRRVAIKVLDRPSAGRELTSAAPRLLKEARVMAGLRHPNLCPVHEIVLEGSLPFIVMQWIDGRELTQGWRALDLHARLALFMKVVDAAAHMHAHGAMHADLKPGNVLVDPAGEPIIVDFGLSRPTHDADAGTSIAGGTPGYAPLEQFEPGGAVGPQADVFALGAMLYELLTDRVPYEAPTLNELLTLMRAHMPVLPEEYAPDAPWPLQRICLTALERDPGRRYPDAGAMLTDLNRYLRGETVAARPSTLIGQFLEKVDQQLRDVDSWRRQELITEGEAERLNRVLSSIVRPETHWILDSRRLSASQVTLYLGGWLALVALSVGLVLTGDYAGAFGADALGSWVWLRPAAAWLVTWGMIRAGVSLQRRREHRIALGYLITGCLAMPVAMWLTFRETLWFSEPMRTVLESGEEIAHEWLPLFTGMELWPDSGLANRQMFFIATAWFVCAAVLRRFSHSSAFTPFGAIAGVAVGVATWATIGMLSPERESYGMLGLFLAAGGLAVLPLGLRLSRREQATIEHVGLARLRRQDAWPVLGVSVGLTVIGLTLAAYFVGDWFTFGLLVPYDDASTRAAAFMINGFSLQLLAHVLGRRRTLVRARLAGFLRWLTPTHILGGLLVLQIDAAGGAWAFWLVMLGMVSIVICYLSVWKQWRPFLFSGLFYLAIGYGRAFFEAFEQLGDETATFNTVRLVLTIAMLIGGVVTMIIAMRIPSWRAVARLRQWRKG